ncbi:transposase [Microbacterium lacticum]|uniref:transposase n=1 Tax=Microbacterium lacticum TaxID=33885 RepID=UPI0028D1F571|nr:transposase [Microbacterium lacticum]
MNLLRHGGMGRLFDRTYAPSTLGSFLREFRFGHVRQLDAVASRTLVNLASAAPLLQIRDGERVMVDVDDTIIEVHGYQKQGASFGYSGVRGLNALVATASTTTSAPVILAQRLRQGKTGSPKGAARIIADTLATLRRMDLGSSVRPLLRADSAFYGHATIGTAIKADADVSVTVRMDPAVKRRSRRSPRTGGRRSSTRTRSVTRSRAGGSRRPRSPRCPSQRSVHGRSPNGLKDDWWSNGSQT